jgi:hypothetical protein
MSEILASHRLDVAMWLGTGQEYLCICGNRADSQDAHQEEMLAGAGFGKLEDAWDEGQKSGMRHADRVIAAYKIGRPELPGPPSPNPYRNDYNPSGLTRRFWGPLARRPE